MKDFWFKIIISLVTLPCFALLAYSTVTKGRLGTANFENAQKTLIVFFSYLHDGEYELASTLYGGEYKGIRDHNPHIDPNDLAALLQNACTVNGAQCLEVRQATFVAQPTAREFQFSVEFFNDDGSVFSLGPCCGDNEIFDPVKEFTYTVRLKPSGKYIVLDTPVYIP